MAWGPYAAPEAEAEASPGQVDMDITLPVPRHAAQDLTHQGFFAPGDVTAAVPSLGDLARADEEGAAEEQEEQEDALMGNITAAIPGFGALVEEDEAGQEATAAGMELTEALGGVLQAGSPAAAAAAPPPAGSPDLLDMFAPSPAPSAPVPAAAAAPPSAEREAPASSSGVPPSGQVNKWGFVPGDDDTMEMDMMQNGAPPRPAQPGMGRRRTVLAASLIAALFRRARRAQPHGGPHLRPRVRRHHRRRVGAGRRARRPHFRLAAERGARAARRLAAAGPGAGWAAGRGAAQLDGPRLYAALHAGGQPRGGELSPASAPRPLLHARHGVVPPEAAAKS
jgi:hypothetical protein